MTMRYAVTLGLLLALTPAAALAQTDPAPVATPTPAPAGTGTRSALEQRDVPAPAGRDDSLLQGAHFKLDVSDDETSVAFELGESTHAGEGSLSTNWQIRLSVPIEGLESLKPGSQIDLMADGTKLTFSASFLSFGGTEDPFVTGRFQREIWPRALAECARRRAEGGTTDAEALHNCQYYTSGLEKGELRTPGTLFANRFVDVNAVNRVLYGNVVRGGIEGSIGFDKFEYVDPLTLAKMDPNKTQASASGFVSWYPAGRTSVLTFRGEYQNAFEAQPEQAVCKPVVVDPATDCVNGSLAPVHVERANFSVEYRQLFDTGWEFGTFAISPKATFDAVSNEFEAEFPLYFIPAKAGPFSPGVEMRYSSKTDELTLGFFVRSTFKY